MTYKGHVKGGVVVFEEGTPPPEGVEVWVQILETSDQSTTVWQKLQKYSGNLTDLPADMARNHDHYIHGGPRK